MFGTGLLGFLSSPDDLLCSPYEVGGGGVECVCKLRDLVDLDVAFCGESCNLLQFRRVLIWFYAICFVYACERMGCS